MRHVTGHVTITCTYSLVWGILSVSNNDSVHVYSLLNLHVFFIFYFLFVVFFVHVLFLKFLLLVWW